LMMFVEQGIAGGFIFLILIVVLLIYCQRVYHETEDLRDKAIIMAASIGIIIILSLNLINDLLETDKVGAYFFAYASIIVLYSIKSRSANKLVFPNSNY